MFIRKQKLMKLYDSWIFQAKKRVRDSDLEETELGRRALFNSGIVHLNLAEELLAAMQPQFGFSRLLEIFKNYFKRT